ncbi:MAG: dynamin family protein, partial [Parahaliea sp.]
RSTTQERIKRLEAHLRRENPVLAGCVQSFQRLDRIARKLGVMGPDESYANQVSWWPVISVLGTFSAGKSTFMNQYVGEDLQRTGNQAVDDKFTVICYGAGAGDTHASLPGLALDSDPRFPFYQISQAIEKGAVGEGRRVDSYLQLKTVPAQSLRGKIFIDSPGFDADQQRTSTLLLTEHIINLSDLVLVFFDARHPEPGAMADTLEHLVAETVHRPDSNKFLYVLNQIDNTAREDNPEEVVAAWQRSLAQHGLTAGRFYRIYARGVTVPIEDERVRERLERKRDEDLADIEARIRQVEVERAYRVVGVLDKTAKQLRDEVVPRLTEARRSWRRRTAWLSIPVFGALIGVFLWWTLSRGMWEGTYLMPFVNLPIPLQVTVVVVALLLALLLHSRLRLLAGRGVLRKLERDASQGVEQPSLARGFGWNLRAWWTSLLLLSPRGWGGWRRKQLDRVLADADGFVQALNDRYARPSGAVEDKK